MSEKKFPKADVHDGVVLVIKDAPSEKQSVIVVPGYAEGVDQFRSFCEEIAETSDVANEILTFSFPRKQKLSLHKLRTLYPNAPKKDFFFESVLLRKMHRFIEFVESEKLKEPTIIGHSAGAITAVFSAYFRPDLFQNSHLILVNPAGFIKETSTIAQNRRFFKNWINELFLHRFFFVETVIGSLGYIFSRPKQSYLESKAIAFTSINTLLVHLLKRYPLRCTLIFDTSDKLFESGELTTAYVKIKSELDDEAVNRFNAEVTDVEFSHYGMTTDFSRFAKVIKKHLKN